MKMNEPSEAISAFDITFLGTDLGAALIACIVISAVLIIRREHTVQRQIDALNIEVCMLERVREIDRNFKATDETLKSIVTNLEEMFLNQAAFSQSLFDMHAKVDSQSPDSDTFQG
jgi:hypothetical protein